MERLRVNYEMMSAMCVTDMTGNKFNDLTLARMCVVQLPLATRHEHCLVSIS